MLQREILPGMRQKYAIRQLVYPGSKAFRFVIIIAVYALYIAISFLYHNQAGIAVAALSTIPVMIAGWYFRSSEGMLTALFLTLANLAILMNEGYSATLLLSSPDTQIGLLALVLIGWVVGKLGFILRERREVIAKLEKYEEERQIHTNFLESLNEITGMALEANSLDSTLTILVERIGRLFDADDCFFSRWDEAREAPVPIVASGSLRDVYPYIQFEPGERTLSVSVLEAKKPIGVTDIKNSPFIGREVATIFPSRSMLALPLVVQNRKLGAILLGYKNSRSFAKSEITRAATAAEQIALVLSKSLVLEEERRQVKQLTALHDIALISIHVDNEDELINRVTDVIGQNVFPDNFGILLFDEQSGILRAHPSYRFFSSQACHTMDLPLHMGVTGKVATTGKPQRIENVRCAEEYYSVDERTVSELCVPIKFKEHILGVINAESTKMGAFTEDDERLLITLAGQIATAMEQMRKAQAERKWLDQLAHSNELIYSLAQITTHIEKAFSPLDIIRNLGHELRQIDLTCIMASYDKEQDRFTITYTSMEPKLLEIVETTLGLPLIDYIFSGKQLDREDLLHPTVLSSTEDEVQKVFARMRTPDILSLLESIGIGPEIEPLRLPLIFEENLLGMIWIWGKNLTKADLPIMSIFAKQIGVSLERARLFQEVQSLALTDPLTGLQNRRSLFELGRVEFARAHRMNRAFCCMMLDLDHFKQVNDTYGHPVGDQVLKEFARRCKASVREVDLVGRYGGEELVILLPETDRKTAMQVAERLRSSIAAAPIRIEEKEIAMTVSIGVAAKDENTLHLDTLIARADQAMYIAKHKGRNQVAMSK